eukprot:1974813-Prymnesium_polylepis.3
MHTQSGGLVRGLWHGATHAHNIAHSSAAIFGAGAIASLESESRAPAREGCAHPSSEAKPREPGRRPVCSRQWTASANGQEEATASGLRPPE